MPLIKVGLVDGTVEVYNLSIEVENGLDVEPVYVNV